nr:hypothetical protein GCM10020093_040630 [Planobispora longispora]
MVGDGPLVEPAGIRGGLGVQVAERGPVQRRAERAGDRTDHGVVGRVEPAVAAEDVLGRGPGKEATLAPEASVKCITPEASVRPRNFLPDSFSNGTTVSVLLR